MIDSQAGSDDSGGHLLNEFGWHGLEFAKQYGRIGEPLEGRNEHEHAGDETQHVEDVARRSGDDGECGIVAFDGAGNEHQHNISEDAPVPDVEGPSPREDPSIFAEQLHQDEDEQSS